MREEGEQKKKEMQLKCLEESKVFFNYHASQSFSMYADYDFHNYLYANTPEIGLRCDAEDLRRQLRTIHTGIYIVQYMDSEPCTVQWDFRQ